MCVAHKGNWRKGNNSKFQGDCEDLEEKDRGAGVTRQSVRNQEE